MKALRIFSRLLVGVVFIFSGFVKGVDPLGTVYRMDDYFIAFGTEWAMFLSLFLAISLSALEFVLGIALIFNTKMKFFSWILFLLMIFFTGLTLNDAITNMVPDCGCFGDAITLSNWNTFYKNVFLMIFVSIIFFTRKKIDSTWSGASQWLVIVIASASFVWFSFFNLNHLPVIDFMDWEIGNQLVKENEEAKVYLSYQNKETGEIKEYLSPNYPWNDSVWMTNWAFVGQRFEENGDQSAELKIEDVTGDDYTRLFIENPDYQFLVVAYDLDICDVDAFQKLNSLYKTVEQEGLLMIGLTSTIPEKVEKFRAQNNIEYDFYFADDIVLKTMVRASPGLILLKDGVVLNKWHFNDFPTYADVFAEHIEN
jgi:uncharacterized membrane protein YphA (DoxX/SURF4 family)